MITPIQKSINIDPIKVPKKTQSFKGVTKIGKEAADAFTKTSENLKGAKIFDKLKGGLTKGFNAVKKGFTAAKDFVVKYAKKAFEFVSKKIGEFKDVTKNVGNKSKTLKNTIVAGTAAGGVAASGVAIHKVKGKEKED